MIADSDKQTSSYSPRACVAKMQHFAVLTSLLYRQVTNSPLRTRMSRQIVLDVSHLITRLTQPAPTGVDRVDLAYARYFVKDRRLSSCGTQYGLFRPHVLMPSRVKFLVGSIEQQQAEDHLEEVLAESFGHPATTSSRNLNRLRADWSRRATQWRFRTLHKWGAEVPKNAIYLNVAQHAFEHRRFFRWLDERPDVIPVFFVHDLLPLDFPEFFPEGYRERFMRRVKTMQRARAIITSTEYVAERIAYQYRKNGLAPVSIHVEPLASPLAGTNDVELFNQQNRPPYFVVISTIEPRKNHMLLINVWRTLISRSISPPKLVLVGKRGWENEQTLRELDAPELRQHIVRMPSLPPAHLKALLKNAVALLMPSFAEGYGLPIVEALSLSVPVICSDIPVFREISRGKALLMSPIDGMGWLRAIEAMASPKSLIRTEYANKAKEFGATDWGAYFENIEGFLATI